MHETTNTDPASPRLGRIAVTVTTVRYHEPLGEPAWMRESRQAGEFTQALYRALSERLERWALHQVLGRVLACYPKPDEAIEYEGMFSPLRHLLILAQPLHRDGTPRTDPLHQVYLEGLNLDAGVHHRAQKSPDAAT